MSGREALRRSTREKDYVGSTKLAVATDSQDQVIRAMRMSITQAMKDKGMEPHTVKAIAAEIENLDGLFALILDEVERQVQRRTSQYCAVRAALHST